MAEVPHEYPWYGRARHGTTDIGPPLSRFASVQPTLRRATAIRPGLVLSIIVLVIVSLWAVAPGLFTIYDPFAGLPGQQLKAPSALHLLGTDSLGRDLYGRIVYGAINSLSGALAAVGIGLVVGTTLGIFAGSLGGWVDAAIMRFVDVLLSIPALLLSLSVIALLGFGTGNAAIAVGVTSIASFARLVRSEVVTVRRSDYVEGPEGDPGSTLAPHPADSLTSVKLRRVADRLGPAACDPCFPVLGAAAAPEWGC